MPAYGSVIPTQSSAKGQPMQVWNAETPTPGTGGAAASIALALPSQTGRGGMPFGVDLKFSAAPGAFEVDVQVAAIDADANYQTVANGNITSVDSTNNTAHFDGSLVVANFVRLLMRTRTNTVSITAYVTGG